MSYAYGKHALAICDRCGFRIKYLELKTEWTGSRVCADCWEPKHPQLEPKPVKADAEALWKPRPDVPEEPPTQLWTPDGVEDI